MLVAKVADTDVTAMTYAELLGLLKAKARPRTLLFEPQAARRPSPVDP